MDVTGNEEFKINNIPINEKAYRILKESIIRQKLDLNKTLTEKELADLLGISRTPLREALKKLEADGFIDRKPHNRIMITKLSMKHAENLYIVRSRLEGLAAALAAKHITEAEIIQLEWLLEQSTSHWEKKEYDKFDENGRLFHRCIHKASTNEVCEYMLRTLSDHINRYRWISLRSFERPKVVLEDHRTIIDYLKKGDSVSAENKMKDHIVNSSKLILENLQKYF